MTQLHHKAELLVESLNLLNQAYSPLHTTGNDQIQIAAQALDEAILEIKAAIAPQSETPLVADPQMTQKIESILKEFDQKNQKMREQYRLEGIPDLRSGWAPADEVFLRCLAPVWIATPLNDRKLFIAAGENIIVRLGADGKNYCHDDGGHAYQIPCDPLDLTQWERLS